MSDDPTTAGGEPPVEQIQTRFLLPFFFDRESVGDAMALLRSSPVVGREGVWVAERPPGFYLDELVEHVAAHFFPQGEPGSGCGYLRVAGSVANSLFRDLTVELRRGERVSAELVWSAGVEIFLSPQGVGVFSVTLGLRGGPVPTRLAFDFNYGIARRHRESAAVFRIAHPSDDEARWAKVPEVARQKIAPPPDPKAPLSERLGAAGGVFSLSELALGLLAPLAEKGLREIQHGFSVHSAVLLGADVDFSDARWRRELEPLLSGLAQVEEPGHAGSAGEMSDVVPKTFLNRKHWAAAGQLASAQLLAQQAAEPGRPAPEFNNERLARARDKYFVPYLAALLQRLALHRALDDAGRIVRENRDELRGALESRKAAAAFGQLRQQLLDFSLAGHFTQVSGRQAVHRFYRLCREGLDVAPAWEEVRRAVADMEGRFSAAAQARLNEGMALSAAAQVRLNEGMARSLSQGVDLQKAVHVIEIFLVSVYSAHLVLMLLEEIKPLLEGHEAALHAFHVASPILVAGAALVGFLATRAFVKRHDSPHGENGHAGR